MIEFMEKNSDKNTREKILKVAVKLFAQKGFDGVSIRDICREADTNVCMISYYFKGKKELYNAIINSMIERQTEYAAKFLDFNRQISDMSRAEQIDILMLCLDKFVDFFYSNVSSDLIVLLLKEQQNKDFMVNSPALNFMRKLIAGIMNKEEDEREVIFTTVFIMSQINSPRILPAFSLRLLGQDDFTQEDIKIIKKNVKFYVTALFREAKIV